MKALYRKRSNRASVAVGFEEEMKKYRSNYYLSPRTISKCNDLLKANALLCGRYEANQYDVEKLYYLLCTLNEPLDENRNTVSQQMFNKVFQKYFILCIW